MTTINQKIGRLNPSTCGLLNAFPTAFSLLNLDSQRASPVKQIISANDNEIVDCRKSVDPMKTFRHTHTHTQPLLTGTQFRSHVLAADNIFRIGWRVFIYPKSVGIIRKGIGSVIVGVVIFETARIGRLYIGV